MDTFVLCIHYNIHIWLDQSESGTWKQNIQESQVFGMKIKRVISPPVDLFTISFSFLGLLLALSVDITSFSM